jgi:uncharacterized membrane protein YfcA
MAAALVGLVVGLVVGLTSMGGGALLTPALIYVLGVPPSMAVGSDVLIASLTKVFGGGAYALRKQVRWSLVGRLALGSIPGAIVGKQVLGLLPKGSVDGFIVYGLGGILLFAASFTMHRVMSRNVPLPKEMPSTPVIVLLGALTGMVVTVTSVGSGSLLIVALLRLVPLPLTTLVGTDLVHALLLSVVATILHARTGNVNSALAATVLVGAIPGVLLGSGLAKVIPERPMRGGLAVVLALIGVTLLVQGPNKPLPAPAATLAAAEVSR